LELISDLARLSLFQGEGSAQTGHLAQVDTVAPRTTSMKHRNNHFAVGYWSLIRRGRPAPDQADVDPKALKRLLPFVFLLDARHSSFVYRLAGTTLCERYGGELRGRDFLAQWDCESRTLLPSLMKEALADSTPLWLSSVGTTEDRKMIEIETVLMPMTFSADTPERFLGVAQVMTDVSPLMGRCINFERLVASGLVREGECTAIEALPPIVSPPPVRAVRRSRTARGAHLKLVVSQAQPAPDQTRLGFNGNDALAALVAKCETERGGRFSG
jgi:hypothetical protein